MAYQRTWGEKDADGNPIPSKFEEIETEPCTVSDINMAGDSNQDKYRFYEPSEEFAYDIKRFASELQCMKQDAVLRGDFNSARGNLLVITFEICRDEPDTPIEDRKCRPEEEIFEWMERKWIATLENQISFSRELIEDNLFT